MPGAAGAAPVGSRLPPGQVGIGGEEGEDVPQGDERLAGGLPDAVLVDPTVDPRRAGGEEVPAQGVGAEGVEHVPRVEDVALRLRHLGPELVDHVGQAHHVAVRRGPEDERVHRQQRVEPPPGLVDGLADEVGGERLLELGPSISRSVAERVVVLGRRHRPRVEPGVEHRRHPRARRHRTPASDRGSRRRRPPGRCRSSPARSRPARRDSSSTDPTHVSWPLLAPPDGQGRAPVPVPGQGPVDVVLQPVAEAAVLDVVGVPVDVLVLPQEVRAVVRRAHEPRRLGPVDERRPAPPAVGVGVGVRLLPHQQAPGGQVVDDRPVGVLHPHAGPRRHVGPEGAVGTDRVEDRQVVGPGRVHVVGAEGGRQVDDARPVLGRHERRRPPPAGPGRRWAGGRTAAGTATRPGPRRRQRSTTSAPSGASASAITRSRSPAPSVDRTRT